MAENGRKSTDKTDKIPHSKRPKLSVEPCCDPEPVLDDVYTSPVELIDVYVAEILDKKETSRLLRVVSSVFPLATLQHLKRIKGVTGSKLQMIVALASDFDASGDGVEATLEIRRLFGDRHDLNLKGLHGMLYRTGVPNSVPLTREQYSDAIKYWPTNFHEDKTITALMNRSYFSVSDKLRIQSHMKTAIIAAVRGRSRNRRSVGSVIVDPKTDEVMAVAEDFSTEHPLRHSVMAAIDLVAKRQLALPSGSVTQPDKKNVPYLCTDYELYTTREPCVMCSMALLHSRIRTVFYGCEVPTGGLGSAYKIHTKQGLNHHFQVFKGILKDECVELLK